MAEPIWTRGRVPNGYWRVRPNRLRYMNWLKRRLGFTRRADWYDLTRQDFIDHHGGGLLATVYDHSPIKALNDILPDIDFKPWLMAKAPQGFWARKHNRWTYMAWLGDQLGIRSAEDWYAVTKADFIHHYGEGLLVNHFGSSPLRAIREFLPRHDWIEWRFAECPQRFWHSKKNRKRYLGWLGRQLGYRRPEDWYRVTRADFYRHHGAALLQSGFSAIELLREAMPNEGWQPWRFARVPAGFWHKRANQDAYLRWLGETLGIKHPDGWDAVTAGQVRGHHGSTLLTHHYRNAMTRLRRRAKAVMATTRTRRAA